MTNQQIGVIIQARMTSTRLPGKVLLPVDQSSNLTMLDAVINRVSNSKMVNQIIVATTTNQTDDPIVELVNRRTKQSIQVFRGSEEDVLARYYLAATKYQLDHVIRITSDCPLIDSTVMDQMIRFYLDHLEEYDYVSNIIQRSYPRGLDLEIFSYQTLKTVYQVANSQPEREHVTAYIYRHPEEFRLYGYAQEVDQSQYRLTVDTPIDLELIRKIYHYLYRSDNNFGLDQIIELLNQHPEWAELNQDIEQKYKSQQQFEANRN